MSTEQKTRILRMLERAPGDLSYLTFNPLLNSITSFHLDNYLKDLETIGYIRRERNIWHITEVGLSHLNNKPGMAEHRFYVPPEPYKPPSWESTRPGADDHKKYKSLNVFEKGE